MLQAVPGATALLDGRRSDGIAHKVSVAERENPSKSFGVSRKAREKIALPGEQVEAPHVVHGRRGSQLQGHADVLFV